MADRDETPDERFDRNWSELLQELRVAQTGVQFLFAFLLTLPFNTRFATVSQGQKATYVATILCTALSALCLIAPVSHHRILFRRGQLPRLVATAHVFTLAGIVFLGVALTGAVVLVVGILLGDIVALIIGGVTTLLFVWAWLLYPWRFRVRSRPHSPIDGS